MSRKRKSAKASAEVFARAAAPRPTEPASPSPGPQDDLVLRPVLDPTLPHAIADRLRRAPSHLREADTAPRPLTTGHALWFVSYGVIAELCVAAVVLQLASVPGWTLAFLLIGSAAVGLGWRCASSRVPSDLAAPHWPAVRPWRTWATALSLAPVPLHLAVFSWLPDIAYIGLFAVLFGGYAAGALWVGWRWPRGDRLALAHAHRYFVPKDFGKRGSGLVARVQWAIDRTAEADALLGDSFDGRAALTLLRSQEWDIALTVREYEALRRDYWRQLRQAASERVTEALRAQFDGQEATFRALAQRVDRIEAYGRDVVAAIGAHQEWQQVQHVEERGRRISGLMARASIDGGESDALRQESLSAHAARQVRDELVGQALDSGRRLVEAVHPRTA